MLTKQAVVRFPLSFPGYLCVPRAVVSLLQLAARSLLENSSISRLDAGRIVGKRRTEDRVSLRNSLRKGPS